MKSAVKLTLLLAALLAGLAWLRRAAANQN